jgi:hypothetical protein
VLSRFVALLILTSGLAAWQAPAPPQKPPAPILPGDSSIAGRVLDRITERPLAGIVVTLLSLDRKRALATTTDDAGRFEIAHVAAGDYRVTALHPDYVTTEYGLKEGRTGVTPRDGVVRLERGVPHTGVNFSLARGGTIAGKVMRHDGTPLKDARIFAMAQFDDTGGFSVPPGAAARTNAQGEYVLSRLPDGHYRISATWSEEDSRRPVTRTVFYPGTIRAQDLQTVRVSLGEAAKDINIVFPASELLRISGKVVFSGGARHIEAALMTEQGILRVSVAPDGSFTTPHLPSGRYALVARARSDEIVEAGIVSVDLSSDIADLVLGLMPTGLISGRVVTDDGTPVSDEMQVAAVLVDDGKEVDQERRDRAAIGARGEFEVRGVFGQRVLRMVGVTAGWKIARVTIGKDEATTLSVAPGVTISDVLVVLTRS